MGRMRFVSALLVGCMALACAAPASVAAQPQEAEGIQSSAQKMLDGKRFRVRHVDASSAEEDLLVFRNGKFISENCRKAGFTESPYYTRVEGDRIHFLTETESPSTGTMLWRGSVRGDEIHVEYLWTKKRWYWTIQREYRLAGSRLQ